MEENKIKYLEMIQSIIQRMANNSFFLKGWTVSLIVAIFILADNTMNQIYFGFTYIPVLMFWVLDSYYLQLERRYAVFYDNVRKKNEIDFNLNIKNVNYKNVKIKHLKYINCLFSVSEFLFYIPTIVLLTIIFKGDINFIFKNLLMN